MKRVALDFHHPLREVWPGFVRQGREFPPCPDCRWGRNETLMDRLFPSGRGTDEPTGLTREAYAVDNTFYAHMIGGPLADVLAWHDKIGQAEVDMLVAEGRLKVWRDGEWHSEPRTATEVNAANGRGRGMDGHDGINRWLLCEYRCKVLGIERECPTCKGHCDIATDEERAAEEAAAEAWQPTEPPAGEGWQLWETVSEGSPISPVFDSDEALATWCTQNDCTVNGPMRSFDAALRFVRAGWAPSFMSSDETGVVDGMTYVGERAES